MIQVSLNWYESISLSLSVPYICVECNAYVLPDRLRFFFTNKDLCADKPLKSIE